MRGEQLARQWRLIQRLARSRAGVGLDDLATDLECTRRTVYRDLDALMFAGFPVVSERRETRVFYRFLDTYQLGDAPFTPDEILALAFSEDLLRTLEGTVFHDSICSALDKIRAGLGPELSSFLSRLAEAFRVLPGPHKPYARFRDTIQRLNDAVLARERVRLRYRTGRTGKVSERGLDPYRVWYRSGGLYVVGLDHKSGEIRTFAVERIQRLDGTGEHFEVEASFDFDEFVAGSFGVMAEPPGSHAAQGRLGRARNGGRRDRGAPELGALLRLGRRRARTEDPPRRGRTRTGRRARALPRRTLGHRDLPPTFSRPRLSRRCRRADQGLGASSAGRVSTLEASWTDTIRSSGGRPPW
jgi:predicted DNA-binding transcriptional regulator YafY